MLVQESSREKQWWGIWLSSNTEGFLWHAMTLSHFHRMSAFVSGVLSPPPSTQHLPQCNSRAEMKYGRPNNFSYKNHSDFRRDLSAHLVPWNLIVLHNEKRIRHSSVGTLAYDFTLRLTNSQIPKSPTNFIDRVFIFFFVTLLHHLLGVLTCLSFQMQK